MATMAKITEDTLGIGHFIDNNRLLTQFSPGSEDNFQEDATMMESPDSGYRSPQDYIPTAAATLPYPCSTGNGNEPYLEILEHPIEKFRFRYKSEMAGTHGSLTGVNSDKSRKQSYPTVCLRNYSGTAIIRCSLYQHDRDEDNKPHAHRLVKKFGNDEVDDPHELEVHEENAYIAIFQNMGIIHTAKKFLLPELIKKKTKLKKEQLKLRGENRKLNKREELDIEAEAVEESKTMDLNIVRLRFDAFVRTNYNALMRICPPIYSHCVNNLKSALTGELKIVRMSRCTSPSKGGVEVFLLVEKVTKKHISVRFFEEDEHGAEKWHDYGKFSEVDVHHQYAIVLKTPPYKDVTIDHDVKVFIELVRKSDNSRSDPKAFTYTPSPIHQSIGAKRPRLQSSFSSTCSGNSSRSFNSNKYIPATIPATIGAVQKLSDDFERQSLNGENLSDYLKVESKELERMYAAAFPDDEIHYEGYLPDDIQLDLRLTTDGPVKKNAANKQARGGSVKMTLRELELQYCRNVYKEVHAVRKSNPQESYAVRFLRSQFIDKTKQPSDKNPLHIIVWNYNSETQMYLEFFLSEIRLLKQHSILNLTNNDKETPLHLAVSLDNKEVAEKLIVSKADVNCKDGNGDTVLHLAVKKDNSDIVEVLFRCAANVAIDLENNDGDTALHIAIRRGSYMNLVLLCRNRANVNIAHKTNGYTPLRMAIENVDVKMVKFLLRNTLVDLTISDFKGMLPINAADVLRQANESEEMQSIYHLLQKSMNEEGLPTLKPEIDIKEEVESSSEGGDEEPMQVVEPKKEYDLEAIKQSYEGKTEFTPSALEELCKELDGSRGWQNLADLLDLGHFEETKLFETEPTKNLLKLALNKGESLYQIRDFLDNLDEKRAVQIMDKMVADQ